VRAAGYSFRDFGQYAERNNADTLIIPLIEHPDAVENIEEICAHEAVQILTFGAGDLAYAIGEGTQMLASPKVQAAYRRVLEVAEEQGVAVMGGPVLDPTPQACREAIENGVRVFCLGLDILAFRSFCEETVASLHEAVSETALSRPQPPASGFPGR
jgi:2-keto-3-deoxy-L-rhamnonate aldolase RhmA